MSSVSRKIALGAGVAVGAAALVAGATVALIKPRTGNAEVDARWEQFRRFRYAHRGLHDNAGPAPENSLEAFRRARLAGLGSELDVHLCGTGEVVVVHDSDLERVTGVKVQVEELSFGALERLRLFGTGEPVPTLEQVLEVYEGFGKGETPPLIVELKTAVDNVAELCEKTLALLDAHTVPYCVESFDPRPLVWLRRHRPDVMRGQLSEDWLRREGTPIGPVADFGLTHLLTNVAARPDFIAYRYEDRARRAVQLATRTLGGKYVGWTLRSPDALYATEAAGGLAIFEAFTPDPQL